MTVMLDKMTWCKAVLGNNDSWARSSCCMTAVTAVRQVVTSVQCRLLLPVVNVAGI